MPIYDESYFNGGQEAGYTNYSETTYLTETHEQLATKFVNKAGELNASILGKKVLVVGCAYGFLVKYLVNLGVDAYGMDISSYAISQAPAEISSRVIVGNATSSADWSAIKTLAGIPQANKRFELVIDEDMICCLSDSEAASFRTLALQHSNLLIHLLEDNPSLSQWYNYKTITQWKALLGTSPKEKWYTRFFWSET